MAGGTGSALSSGGMNTKLIAAQVAMRAGCAMAITEGAVDRPLAALASGRTPAPGSSRTATRTRRASGGLWG